MKVVAIVQARMGSTRLPGKVLRDVAGEPLLSRVVNRLDRVRLLDRIVVATTVRPVDDVIARLCSEKGWPCFRGSEADVLDRYYRAACSFDAGVVVRITADCPLIDPGVVDRVVQEFLDGQPEVDYACNVLPRRTFPRGLDTEVIRFDVLERAWREDNNPTWREHVTPYIWKHPQLFHIHGIVNETDYSHLRWTVDTREDLEFVQRVYGHFGHDAFSWYDVLAVLDEHPEWLEINRRVHQRGV